MLSFPSCCIVFVRSSSLRFGNLSRSHNEHALFRNEFYLAMPFADNLDHAHEKKRRLHTLHRKRSPLFLVPLFPLFFLLIVDMTNPVSALIAFSTASLRTAFPTGSRAYLRRQRPISRRFVTFEANDPTAQMPSIHLSSSERELFDTLLNVVRQGDGETTTLRVAGGWVRDKLLSEKARQMKIKQEVSCFQEFFHVSGVFPSQGSSSTNIIYVDKQQRRRKGEHPG